MASHGLGRCPLVLIWTLTNVLEEGEVLTASKVWMGKWTLTPSLTPASGLALMRPHLFSAKFLYVQISNLELNAEFVSPKELKYHGM